MAYVTVPKDLTRVKSKIVFGLTKRQLICFGGALLVGVPLYFLLRGRVTGSAAALIMVFAMLPGFLLALYERHGQPLEVVVWQIVQCCFRRVHEAPIAKQTDPGHPEQPIRKRRTRWPVGPAPGAFLWVCSTHFKARFGGYWVNPYC